MGGGAATEAQTATIKSNLLRKFLMGGRERVPRRTVTYGVRGGWKKVVDEGSGILLQVLHDKLE